MSVRTQLAAIMITLMVLLVLAGCNRSEKTRTIAGSNEYSVIDWSVLTPPHWDAMALLKDIDLSKMQDNDPRAFELLKDVREQWNNAPVVKSWDGHSISLNGYLVPLDGNPEQIKEFLLVPYFGACIHSPPPPSNQIIHVHMTGQPLPLANLNSYVIVSGKLKVAHSNTALGATGYQMQADIVKAIVDGTP